MLESLQIVEEFSKSMQTIGVPLRVVWIGSSFDERPVTAAAPELSSSIVYAIVMLARLAELPLGRYRKNV